MAWHNGKGSRGRKGDWAEGNDLSCFQEPASNRRRTYGAEGWRRIREFRAALPVRRDCETRVMGIACDIKPRREKKNGRAEAPLQKPTRSKRGGTLLLRGLGLTPCSQREARLVAVAVFSCSTPLVMAGRCRHHGMKKVARSSGVAGGDGGAQAPHQSADPGAVGAVHFGAFTRCAARFKTDFFFFLTW